MKSVRRVPILIAGKGRIGGAVSSSLIAQGYFVKHCRIHPQAGISALSEFSGQPFLLVICISAFGKSWSWDSLLVGLVEQLKSMESSNGQVIFVSSTRVFDGIASGEVAAATPVKPASQKAQQLVAAESQLASTNLPLWIMRPSGLYGDEYPKYLPIMKNGAEKPRFGIDSQRVSERLVQLSQILVTEGFSSGVEVMTDGFAYHDNQEIMPNTQEWQRLCGQFRMLKASVASKYKV